MDMLVSKSISGTKPASASMTKGEKKVIFASSLGTVFEWYDFFLYGTLAGVIGRHFFSPLPPQTQLIFTLLAFAAGFIVRPFGALVFGRLGDMIGRKYTFLVTILIMGISTFMVGLLPGYGSIGVAAPVLLIALRILQGLALGGEYGGAATYVAEHAPPGKRGLFTSWIQATGTIGLFLTLLIVLGTRTTLGEAAFAEWGWRIPFLFSIVLLGVSVWIRLSLKESPVFQKMKAEGRLSKAPLSEAFGKWSNLKFVFIALFGLVMGQSVIWYTGQFYALFFMTGPLKVDGVTANILVTTALVIATPFFVIFGALSDKIGRKPIIMAGFLLAATTTFPLFKALTQAANPDLAAAQATARVIVTADPSDCSIQFNMTGTSKFTRSCDIAKQVLAASSVSYETVSGAGTAKIVIGGQTIDAYSPNGLTPEDAKSREATFKKAVAEALIRAGYPPKADPAKMNKTLVVAILTLMVIYGAMVYGPLAAALVELFPTRIRYSSMSLPYHIGNGWFGGLLPASTLAIVLETGDMFAGLWYPIVIASVALVVGVIFLPETKNVDIHQQS